MSTAQPSALIKRLVGETLELSIGLNPEHLYEVEAYTNVNVDKEQIPLKKHGDHYSAAIFLKRSGIYFYKIRFRKRGSKSWKWFKDAQGDVFKGQIQVDPSWLSQAIVYNVFVRFFTGIPHGGEIKPGEGGTFDDVKAHLDELKKMGIRVLYLNPIHLIGELYRKHNMLDQLPEYLQPGSPYSIKDYKSIDPELTYDKDTKKHLLSDPQKEFKDLVDAAHERGMFVFMDLVFNHTAHDFVFQRIRPEWYLYKEDITSLEHPYLYKEDLEKGKPWGNPKNTLAPYDHGVWWTDAAQLNWEYRIPDGPNKPPKNESLKEMWEYFISIPKYWIRHFGVDGFRCDIAYRVPPDFWKACISEARKEARAVKTNLSHDVVFIGEAYTNDLRELQEAGFSAVYGDYSHKLAKPIQLKGYLDYMYNISSDHFPDGSKWFIFPESHDFGRTAQKVLGDRARLSDKAYLANKSRWVLTSTLPGIPLIFNGFEKIEWEPINLFSYGAVNWENDGDLREFISSVNSIRHNHKALQKGDYQFIETNQGLNDSTQLMAYMRRFEDEEMLIVVNMDVDATAGPAVLYLPEDFKGEYRLIDTLSGKQYQRKGQELIVELNPGESHIFEVLR